MGIVYRIALILAILKIVGFVNVSWVFIIALVVINFIAGMIIAGRLTKFK
jgi:hypothetical protein